LHVKCWWNWHLHSPILSIIVRLGLCPKNCQGLFRIGFHSHRRAFCCHYKSVLLHSGFHFINTRWFSIDHWQFHTHRFVFVKEKTIFETVVEREKYWFEIQSGDQQSFDLTLSCDVINVWPCFRSFAIRWILITWTTWSSQTTRTRRMNFW